MRTSTFLASTVVLASVASTLAAPAHISKRAFACAPQDDNGGALTQAGTPDANQEVSCHYTQGGDCVYFDGNGTFSSGSSVCPNAMVEDTGSSSTTSEAAPSTTVAQDTTAAAASTTSSPTAITVTATSTSTAADTTAAADPTVAGTTTNAAGSTSSSVGTSADVGSTTSSSAAQTTATVSANSGLSLAPRTWGLGAAVFALWFVL